ncbi:MAG: Hpt domain-containing protein, partial [Gammaproteobacteria bacterium]|nr:Hpt domain-containing protein [Gammaproteobacteria bacterium]
SVHSLAGSAGTFGFAEVGTSARQLLNTIKEWQKDTSLNNVLIEEIEIQMGQFEQVVKTACNQM